MLSLSVHHSRALTHNSLKCHEHLKVVRVPVEVNHQMSHMHVCRALLFKKIEICIA